MNKKNMLMTAALLAASLAMTACSTDLSGTTAVLDETTAAVSADVDNDPNTDAAAAEDEAPA